MRLIAIDLDGTLLSTDGSISKENVSAIQSVQKKGDIVTICSGRSLHDTKGILIEADLECPMITGNGAVIYYKNSYLQNSFISDLEVKELINDIRTLDLYTELYTNEGIYLEVSARKTLEKEVEQLQENTPNFSIERAQYMIETQFRQKGLKFVDNCHDFDFGPLQVNKVFLMSFDESKLLNFRKLVAKRKRELSLIVSDLEKLEIGNSNVSKGNGLVFLADYLGVPMKETIVIGDNLNDLSMFEVAGMKVAMANAVEVLKRKADFVTGHHNKSGVAEIILKEILGN